MEKQNLKLTNEQENIFNRYEKALAVRSGFEAEWNECYHYALPQKSGLFLNMDGARKNNSDIFDSTAEAGVEQLAGSLLSQLTPPWSRWFGLGLGVDESKVDADERKKILTTLDDVQKTLQSHFDRSNFYVEAHQCYLDLITIGTAVMLMQENSIGDISAFKFTSVPMNEVALEEGVDGKLDTVFRKSVIQLENLRVKFPDFDFDVRGKEVINKNPDVKISVMEAVVPKYAGCVLQGYSYTAFVLDEDNLFGLGDKFVIKEGVFPTSPFICFRWMKTSSEIYGRSPVMKALPDIKTANKVVELILKNASIAVSGVWQADDDGVLNLDNISLAPGTIIPKAVGSSGLTPLRTGADFDVSQLVLSDLRTKINHSLLIDQISVFTNSKMTATEVIERTNQMSRMLGATYGRLQSEFLTPVILKAISILKRRGEIPDMFVNSREVDLKYQSPLAKNQAVRDAENVLSWIKSLVELGTDALSVVDKKAVALWLAKTFSVPEKLIVGNDG